MTCFRYKNKAKPIKKAAKLNIGDEFVITLMASDIRRYKVVKFPTENTVYGERSNMALSPGSGYYPTVYVPLDIVKKAKIKKEKLPKIKVGEFFTVQSNNIVFKCIEKLDDGMIKGKHDLKLAFENSIVLHRSAIKLSTKKVYKQQHKAEKT